MSVATISRLRAGERVPLVSNMAKVADLLEWPIDEQWALAYHQGKVAWRDEFERRIQQHYDQAVPESGDQVVAGAATGDSG